MLELSPGAELAGYRIEAVAGRGGMGVVYFATDLALERPVALKLISGELAEDVSFRERFKRESKLAASIRHPNVITVFRAGEEDGRLYIAMDYIEGTDLKALIGHRGRLAPPDATRIIAQVAAALDAAHAKTLVHRDVKPANVLIAGEGEHCHAYLTDFGLTKNTASHSAMTGTGVVVGTIDYMAPEQIEGAPLDARADIYSLGCVLYEALTGKVPYPKESQVAKMFAHASEPPPSVLEAAPDVPPGFEDVVKRAMAKDRDERYPSAGDLGRATTAAAEGIQVATPERSVAAGEAAPGGFAAERAPTATVASRKRTRLIAVAAALAVVAAAALILTLGGDGGPEPLSKGRYQDEVLDATRPLTAEISQLGDRLPTHVNQNQDAIKAAADLASAREATDETIAKLEGLIPPADVDDLHARIIKQYKRIRAAIADAGAAADVGNDRIYRATPAKLDKDFAALLAMGPEFKALGYKRLGIQGD